MSDPRLHPAATLPRHGWWGCTHPERAPDRFARWDGRCKPCRLHLARSAAQHPGVPVDRFRDDGRGDGSDSKLLFELALQIAVRHQDAEALQILGAVDRDDLIRVSRDRDERARRGAPIAPPTDLGDLAAFLPRPKRPRR